MIAPLVRLGEVADVNWGDTSVTKSSYVDEGYVAYSATGPDGYLPYADYDRPAIVLSAIGARCGKTWFAEGKWSCIKNTIRFWSTDQRLDNRYLYWVTNREDFFPKRGAAQPFITIGDARSAKIRMPPLDEQRRIAAILDKADALRRKRKRAIELLSDVTKSTFLEMFGDPVTNPKGFPKVSFGEIGKLDRGISKHRPRNDPALLGGPYPLIQTGDVASSGGYIQRYSSTYSEAGLKQSKLWPAGTLCITIAANIAETGILMFPACFPDSVVGFTHKEPGMTQFVRVWLSFLKSTLERTAPTVAQKNINLQILRAVQVALPPSQMIAAFGEKLEVQKALMDALGNATSKEENLFSSLQHRAFSGQL